MSIEVETRTLEEVDEVVELLRGAARAAAGQAAEGAAAVPPVPGGSHVRRVMLDNMARRDAGKEGGVDVSMLAEVGRWRVWRGSRGSGGA